MKEKDKTMLSHLRNNARMQLTTMSKCTKIPVATLFDRLKWNEQNTIIKHTCLLDYAKLGFHARAQIFIKAKREEKEAIKHKLLMHPNINSVAKVNEGYMFECIFPQIPQIDMFIEELEGEFKIDELKSYYIMDDLKREGFMSDTYGGPETSP